MIRLEKKSEKKKLVEKLMYIETELKEFQKTTVNWMLEREEKNGGGMLLNEPGLGKTLCCLNVIITGGGRTLVICPAGLIKNWVEEIDKHTIGVSCNVYHGSGRKLNDALINITSYSTLNRDKELLNEMQFDRIILDEAHYIRNSSSQIHKVVIELGNINALSNKWVVTATPIFNCADDMYGYFVFLNLEGVENKKDWSKIKGKDKLELKNINKSILRHSLRLEKKDVLKELKEKKNERIILKFNKDEQEFYDALVVYSVKRMKKLLEKIKIIKDNEINCQTDMKLSKVMRNNVMVYIIRLKQVCDSIQLITKSMNRIKGMSIKKSIEILNYYNKSLNAELEECVVCYDADADTISESCGHKLCGKCWKKILRLIPRCPECRCRVGEIRLLENNVSKDDSSNELFESEKFRFVLNLTKDILNKNEKVIIVSQYVMSLDLIKDFFEKDIELRNIKYITIQGNVKITERMEMIKEFQKEKDIKVCFLSLNAGAEGLTLTSANNLIFVDEWWNNSKMEQCADRIHRIGQEKQVYIYNLKMKGSIEERIEELVKYKGLIVNMILNKEFRDDFDLSWIENVVKLLDKEEEN
jgi:SWI/SNF-related matrix-associated actin-dependent regulator of chromatin subfamily A3